MRALVTGAVGFLGPSVVRALVARGAEVHGTWLGQGDAPPGLDLHRVDLADEAGLERVLDRTRPEVVVHLAGLAHVGESWKRIAEYYAVNLVGTERVARMAQSRRARLVFASSAEVYGPVEASDLPLRESREPAPATPYALTKAAGERWVMATGGVVARIFNVVGAGQAWTYALPAFAAQLAQIALGAAPPVLKVGNLEARRDFVHREDAARALALLTERGEPGGIYNVASGLAPSIREALERLLAVSGVAASIEIDPERLRPADVPELRGDSTRLRALGWVPSLDLDAGLAELWTQALERARRGNG
jgi:GDP-4-dehydro-6-deoxy-D-mannose reductase